MAINKILAPVGYGERERKNNTGNYHLWTGRYNRSWIL